MSLIFYVSVSGDDVIAVVIIIHGLPTAVDCNVDADCVANS